MAAMRGSAASGSAPWASGSAPCVRRILLCGGLLCGGLLCVSALSCGSHEEAPRPPDPLAAVARQIAPSAEIDVTAARRRLTALEEGPDRPWVFRWPLRSIDITSPYGLRMHPVVHRIMFHAGVDFRAQRGEPVLACGPGIVVKAGVMPLTGNTVILNHPGGLATLYAHLDGILVFEGQAVSAGAPVGLIGSTGRSTGPHLHLSVYRIVDGARVVVDPADFVGTVVDPKHPPDWPLPPVPRRRAPPSNNGRPDKDRPLSAAPSAKPRR